MQNLNSKKFIFVLLISILSFIVVLAGKLSSENWLTFVEYLGTAYLASDVVAGGIDKLQK